MVKIVSSLLKRDTNFVSFCVASTFFARAIQYIFFDSPLRTILWSEELLSPLNLNWNKFVTSMNTEALIIAAQITLGLILLTSSILIILKKERFKFLNLVSSIIIIIHYLIIFYGRNYNPAIFIEHSIQMLLPISYLILRNKLELMNKLLKLLLSLTFLGHALFAIGAFPVPGDFIDMCIEVFHFSEESALRFLKVMGALDITFAVLLLFNRTTFISLLFMFSWGLITSIARPLSSLLYDFSLSSLFESSYELIVRIPHFLIPLSLLFFIKKALKENEGLS